MLVRTIEFFCALIYLGRGTRYAAYIWPRAHHDGAKRQYAAAHLYLRRSDGIMPKQGEISIRGKVRRGHAELAVEANPFHFFVGKACWRGPVRPSAIWLGARPVDLIDRRRRSCVAMGRLMPHIC